MTFCHLNCCWLHVRIVLFLRSLHSLNRKTNYRVKGSKKLPPGTFWSFPLCWSSVGSVSLRQVCRPDYVLLMQCINKQINNETRVFSMHGRGEAVRSLCVSCRGNELQDTLHEQGWSGDSALNGDECAPWGWLAVLTMQQSNAALWSSADAPTVPQTGIGGDRRARLHR